MLIFEFYFSSCNKTSPDLKSLYQHNQTEHNYQIVDPLRQSCNLCDSKFSNKSNLTKHMRRVHQIEYEYKSLASLKCPLCELIFNVTSKLHGHIQKEHDISLEKVTLVFESVDGKYFRYSWQFSNNIFALNINLKCKKKKKNNIYYLFINFILF